MATTSKTKSKVFNKTNYVKRLIRELRSGKYEQVEGALRKGEDQFCLWGLGAEIYRQEYNHCEWDDDNNIFTVPDDWQQRLWNNPSLCLDDLKETSDDNIPDFIAKKLKSDGSIRVGNRTICTMSLNDNGVTFEGLAALLEKYPLTNSVSSINNDLSCDVDLANTFAKMFKGTKLEKNWREKAIRDGSDYEEILEYQATEKAEIEAKETECQIAK